MITVDTSHDAAPVQPLNRALHELALADGLPLAGRGDQGMAQAAEHILATRPASPVLRVRPHPDGDGCIRPAQTHAAYSLSWAMPAVCPGPAGGAPDCPTCTREVLQPDERLPPHLRWEDVAQIGSVRPEAVRGALSTGPATDRLGLDWAQLDWAGLAARIAEVHALRPPRLDKVQRVAVAGARVHALEQALGSARASLGQFARNAWEGRSAKLTRAELAERAGVSRPTLNAYLKGAGGGEEPDGADEL
ncbi:helix-turn-helix domain-containing protein [Kitasatospora sp. NPDC088134]|uniref:helix-turn-helix domain-containing protein n=1 Tax=Kitasatospora sp. NPDC088134 TaxID=3364071 RepID=UPI00382A89D7